MLINGVWSQDWDPVQQQDSQGRFVRQSSAFRGTIPAAHIPQMRRSAEQGEPNRYCLYVAYICPWATRALIARELLGLEKYIDVRVVEPTLTELGWKFGDYPGASSPQQAGVEYMHQLYTQTDAKYTGRATVPVLWDRVEQKIVNNESAELLRIFNQDLRELHGADIELYPASLRPQIDQFNQRIYHSFNNGVYRAGFAQSQLAYQEACADVFKTLDWVESLLAKQSFVVGEQLTESDIRLFVTLARFDVAYHGLFKTNKKRIADYPHISRYMERLLSVAAFSHNTRVEHIKQGYYSIKKLNPSLIVPTGPELPWFKYLAQ